MIQLKVLSKPNEANTRKGRKDMLFTKIRAHCSQPVVHRNKHIKIKIINKKSSNELENSKPTSYFSNFSRKIHSQLFTQTMANSWKNENFYSQEWNEIVQNSNIPKRPKFLQSIASIHNPNLKFLTPQASSWVSTSESWLISAEISKLETRQELLIKPVIISKNFSQSPAPKNKFRLSFQHK